MNIRFDPTSYVLGTSIVASLALCAIRYMPSPILLIVICVLLILHGMVHNRTKPFPTLVDKSILITGGGSGLGRAFALEAAHRGANGIHIMGRRLAKLEETKKLIEKECNQNNNKNPPNVVLHQIDVTDKAQVKKVCTSIEEKHGCPDLLINNAGAGDWKHIEETTMEENEQMLGAPYLGAFNMTRQLIPTMMQRGGHIVNVTSLASIFMFRSALSYQVARGAMKTFSHSLRVDLKTEYDDKIGVTLLNAAEMSGTDYFANNKVARPWISEVGGDGFTSRQVAEATFNGIAKGEAEIMTVSSPPLALWCLFLFPALMEYLMQLGTVGLRTNDGDVSSKEKKQ